LKSVIERRPEATTTLHSDAHNPDRKVFHTVYHDDAALKKTQNYRQHAGLKQGDKLSMLDNAPIYAAFNIPDVGQWSLFQRDYPDVVTGLRSRDAGEREKASRQLAILKPEWAMIEEIK